MDENQYPMVLTPDYFELLLNEVYELFLAKHNLDKLPKNYQLYGYGSFDATKPNLKKDLEEIGQEFVNGKYLYDKVRQLHHQRPNIRINHFYARILLTYLGYDSVEAFIDGIDISSEKREQQLSLINQKKVNESAFFLTYYFGEFQSIIKGYTVISQNWKRIHHTFIYRNKDGSVTKLYSQGTITRGRDTLHTKCKMIIDNKLYDGDSEIFYVGQVELSDLHFIQGNYISFNLHAKPVAGRVILERCQFEEEMHKLAALDEIPSYIAQEIRGSLLETPNTIANSYLELSEKSPYSTIYGKIPGTYEIILETMETIYTAIRFEILATNYKLRSLSPDVYFEEDEIELLNKGTILRFRFNLSGMSELYSADIYVKSKLLRGDSNTQDGVFSGVDNENQLVSGRAKITFRTSSDHEIP